MSENKQQSSPFGDVSTEEVYAIVGRLYTQLFASTNKLGELQRALASANDRNHVLEVQIKEMQLKQMIPGAGKTDGDPKVTRNSNG